MHIEILSFEGCPNREEALERVRRVLYDEHMVARIDEIEVTDPDAALNLRFLGSPSVRVNGHDIEPGADERTDFGFMCRTYSESGRVEGAPSIRMIRAAIQRV